MENCSCFLLFKTNLRGHFPEVCSHEPGVHALVFLTEAVLANLRGEINGGMHQSLQRQIYRVEWRSVGKTLPIVQNDTTAGILSK
ncbi:hypothetical protein EUGRSUZ_H04123 [Eucalyptus grandis]|uniref:Uncharacterized protein n=2 Tax=Eucalyptus grandis TaxID=71139 RepID=A0ACC3JWK8_EUCGR|nr:hypothetical protein EUGRSUZ_H04123 [Eucalyptus grandis]